MGDTSNSRYSIIANLAEKKLAIMDEKQQIEGDIEGKKLEIEQNKNDLELKKKELQEELTSYEKLIKRQIDRLERSIASAESGKSSRRDLCDAKIAEIDKALLALQEVSRASADEAK